MAVKFEDYYDTLGVKRDASQDEIRRAYRKLARKFHPDVNKESDASAKFAKISEAYEVLGDPEKRKKYDELGQDWKNGQEFRPPPGWENMEFNFRGPGGASSGGGGFRPGGFSDFFEMFFGRGGSGGGGAGTRGGRSSFEEMFEQQAGGNHRRAGMAEQEVEVTVTLDDVFHGGKRQIELTEPTGRRKKLEVKIPAGATDGSRIRLKGEHLVLRIRLAKHPRFDVQGHDLTTDLHITPAEAALGGKVDVKTFDGPVTVTIPAGAQSGQKLRLRGRGMPKGKHKPGERGDLFVRLLIRVPHPLSDEERKLYEQLQAISKFDPRT
ncbi:DnaJ C-terminal domain-containing protein [Phycisphaerales bacterium AB-hyl4]|uniref:DnaJ C-terminal domain-containing protein n=1 Tax=Natronomicrosphaera hydrolytica TaxID=3242702 RepID=A0ABV4U9K6_9BACT